MRTLLSLLLLLLTLAGCAGATPTPTPGAPDSGTPDSGAAALPLADCQLFEPGIGQVKAQCGTLRVPENPDAPGGARIDLNIAVVKAVSRTPKPDPIFLLAGGPGQAATQAFLLTLFPIERLRFDRDIVLVDQRGTGKSNPLVCPDPEVSGDVLGAELDIEKQAAEMKTCALALPGDARYYTTRYAMRDLDAVRAALGYQTINLLGVSYGTRAALEYLRLYPDRVRTLVLDGVVPPGWALGQSTPADAQRALDMIFARCAAEPACASAFPNLPGEFTALMSRLDADPVEVTIPHPRGGQSVRVRLSRDTLGSAVQLMSYSDITAALLPLAVHSAAGGDYTLLASLYVQNSQSLGESLSLGMYYAVLCAEDAPRLPADASTPGAYLPERTADVRALCGAFLASTDPADQTVQEDFSSSVPALLISGEADPVTPPANGEKVARMLPNSKHLVLPGMGHNNFYAGCLPGVLDVFLQNASARDLDTGCIATIRPQPFFTSPVGPEP